MSEPKITYLLGDYIQLHDDLAPNPREAMEKCARIMREALADAIASGVEIKVEPSLDVMRSWHGSR